MDWASIHIYIWLLVNMGKIDLLYPVTVNIQIIIEHVTLRVYYLNAMYSAV